MHTLRRKIHRIGASEPAKKRDLPHLEQHWSQYHCTIQLHVGLQMRVIKRLCMARQRAAVYLQTSSSVTPPPQLLSRYRPPQLGNARLGVPWPARQSVLAKHKR